jgi:hypothetical protein
MLQRFNYGTNLWENATGAWRCSAITASAHASRSVTLSCKSAGGLEKYRTKGRGSAWPNGTLVTRTGTGGESFECG